MTHITIGTHNAYRGRATFRPFADIIGWQEVKGQESAAKLRRQLPRYKHFVPAGQAVQVPVSYDPAKVELMNAWAVPTHESGRAMGMLGFTPRRYVVVAIFKVKGVDGRLAFVNTHMINAAWGRWRPTRALRRRLWRKHQEVFADVARRLRASDHLVIAAGDLNRQAWDVIPGLRDARYEPRPGLDHIMTAPSKRLRVRSVEKGTTDGSDHRRVVAGFEIR